jgi:hypothetical protein
MVLIQDVLRYFLSPLENRLKAWEAGSGFKAKIGKIFRMGSTGPGVFETLGKQFNNYWMFMFFITQRPWGPLYKRLFEFDMHPTKITFPFFTYGWILAGWLGNNFVEDTYNSKMVANDPDYVHYWVKRYNRALPHNILNWRTSAHYIEINRIYNVEMTKKLIGLAREQYDDRERRKILALTS